MDFPRDKNLLVSCTTLFSLRYPFAYSLILSLLSSSRAELYKHALNRAENFYPSSNRKLIILRRRVIAIYCARSFSFISPLRCGKPPWSSGEIRAFIPCLGFSSISTARSSRASFSDVSLREEIVGIKMLRSKMRENPGGRSNVVKSARENVTVQGTPFRRMDDPPIWYENGMNFYDRSGAKRAHPSTDSKSSLRTVILFENILFANPKGEPPPSKEAKRCV